MLPRAIVFDFDLTLADSMAGFIACHEYAASSMRLLLPGPEAVGLTIGMPLPIAFVQLYGIEDEGAARRYVRLYQERADEVMVDLTVILDGAPDAIRRMANAGVALGILSQKLRYRIEPVLRRDGLLDAFTAVLGGEDVPAFKPDPRGLLLALERLKAPPADSIYVGDTTIDAETANSAAVPFIAVLTGETQRHDFDGYETLILLEHVSQLPDFLGVDSS